MIRFIIENKKDRKKNFVIYAEKEFEDFFDKNNIRYARNLLIEYDVIEKGELVLKGNI